MKTWFGRVCYEKTIPNWVLQAPEEFLKGLMDAYISGDGTVDKRQGTVHATSVSYDLLEGVQHILARFGIYSKMTSRMPARGKFQSVARNYTLTLPAKYSNRFAKTFSLTILEKQKRLNDHHGHQETDQVPSKWKTTNHVVWDKIKTIEEVTPMGEGWVYDVTVAETKNFMTAQLILVRDTFHQAGVASKSAVTRGVPRLRELLKVTQNPKATSLTIYLKPEFRESKEKAREVAQDLELTMLRDIVTTVGLYYDPKNQGMPADTVVPEDKDLLEFYKFFEQRKMNDDANPEAAEAPEPYSYWMLRFEFNREVMFNRNITMDDVAYVLNQKFTNMIHMIYTDFNSEKLVMRIRLVKETLVEDDDYANFKKVQSVILNSIAVRGVPGIKAVSFRKSEDRVELKEGKFEKVPEYALDTDGSNFVEVMNHPAVDPTRLYTTNVHDIIDILGIEAARAILLTEIDSLFASAGVNYRHLGLLADSMTRAGRFMTVDRYGINKNNIGPLAKASFEETEKILLRAALFGEMDPVTGVSSKIMTGQPIRGGTTFSSLLLDEAALMRLQKGLPPVEDMEEEQEELDDDEIAEELASSMDDKCSPVRLRMNAVLPQGDMELEEPDVELNILE
jgi:DNA-directed RNA polymerase II subunit RPB1